MATTSLSISDIKRSATVPVKGDPVHTFKCTLVNDYLIPLCQHLLTLDKYPNDKLPNEKILEAWNIILNGISVKTSMHENKSDLVFFRELSMFSNMKIWKELLDLEKRFAETKDISVYKEYAVIMEKRGNIIYKSILEFLKQQRIINEVEFFYNHVYGDTSDPVVWYTNWETLKNNATRIYPNKNEEHCKIINVLEKLFILTDFKHHDPIYMV